jgi:hypothetical protein
MFADNHRSPGPPLSGAASTEERLRIGTRPSWGEGHRTRTERGHGRVNGEEGDFIHETGMSEDFWMDLA